MKKRRLSNLLGFTLLMASFFASCKVGVNDSSTPDSTKTGVITGRVIYENDNVTDYSDIQVTLFSTNGLMSTNYCVSRGIATNARSVESITTTDQNGNYIFEDVPEGVYTIYASSNSSKQKAVATNVVVRAAEKATAEDLGLIATGSISGKITIDGKPIDVLGLEVFIAGTSYIAKVASDGTYVISDIPAKTNYMLCVQKGEKTIIIKESIEVKANNVLDAETKDISSSEWESTAFEWLGSYESAPKNPKKHGAYFNTLDGCSYIWTGEKWDLLAQAGSYGANADTSDKYKGILDFNDFLPSKFILEENIYSNGCREDFYDLPYYHQLPNLGDKITLELEFTSDTNFSDLKIRFADSSLAAGRWKELTGEEDEWFTIKEITADEKTTVTHTFELQERPIGNVRLNLISSDDSFEKAELTIHSSKITVTSSTGIPNYMNSYSIYGTTEKFIRGDVVTSKNQWNATDYNYQTSILLPPNSYLLEMGDLVTINWEFISDIDIEKLTFQCVDYNEGWSAISDNITISDKIIANEPHSVKVDIPITKNAIEQVEVAISYPKENSGEATLSTINSTLKISRRDVSNNDESSQSKFTCTPTKDGIKFGGSLLTNIKGQTAKCTIIIRDTENDVQMERQYSLADSNDYESWEMVYPLVEKDKEYTFEVSTKCGATTISSEKVIVTAIGGLGEYKIENADTYTVTLSDDKKTLTRTPQVFTNNPKVPVIDYATKYDIYSNSDTATSVWDGVWMPSQYCWESSTNQVRDLTKFDETWFTYDSLKATLKGRRLGVVTGTHAKIAGYTYNGTTEFIFNDYKESFFDWDDEKQYKYFVLYKDPKTGEYYEDVPETSLYYIKEELDENGNIIFTEKDAEGAIEVYGQLISYGDKIYEPAYVPATEIEDHIFSGFWNIDCESQNITQTSFPYPSNDIWAKKEFVPVYLTPVYKPYKFNIHFVDENGDELLPSIKTTQQKVRIESRPPERTNYSCYYWKDSLSEDAKEIYPWEDLNLTKYDTYLYAEYELYRIELRFLNEDGSIFETREIRDYEFSVEKENNRIYMTREYIYTTNEKPVSSEENKVFDYWECGTEEAFSAGQSISSIGKISDVINFYPVFTEPLQINTTNLQYLNKTESYSIDCKMQNSYTVYWADSYSNKEALTTLLNENSLPSDDQADIKVSIYSADGYHKVTESPVNNAPITFVPNINGTYVIKVEPWHTGDTGYYAIGVEESTSSSEDIEDSSNP